MTYRVLIVEDVGSLADVLRMKLARDGHEVVLAKHQREAYRLLDKKEADFVLLDLKLPTDKNDMDPNAEVGFAILDHIRDRFSPSELPVLVMTAYEETSQTAVRALRAGANDYITKPFEDSPVSLDEKLAGLIRQVQEKNLARAKGGRSTSGRKHVVVFAKSGVQVDGVQVGDGGGDLLRLLGSRSVARSPDGVDLEDVRMSGKEIAKALGIQEASVRKNVERFRSRLAADHKKVKGGAIGDQDVVWNARDWKGYGLNFKTCDVRLE